MEHDKQKPTHLLTPNPHTTSYALARPIWEKYLIDLLEQIWDPVDQKVSFVAQSYTGETI